MSRLPRIYPAHPISSIEHREHNIPDPGVYKLAARYISKGEEIFTCFAIERAFRRLYPMPSSYLEEHYWRNISQRYQGQYTRLFGPKTDSLRNLNTHPFWNRDYTWRLRHQDREVKNCRLNALLLMAEICENPIERKKRGR